MRNPTRLRAFGLGLVAAAALAAFGTLRLGAEEAPATGSPPTTTAPDQEEVRVQVPLAGVTVAIDPATGRLRPPTAAEARELAAQLSHKLGRTGPPPAPVLHRDGMISLVVGTDYLDFMVATLDPAGNVTTACVHGSPTTSTLGQPPATPTPEEE
jgi:hypothetical protein